MQIIVFYSSSFSPQIFILKPFLDTSPRDFSKCFTYHADVDHGLLCGLLAHIEFGVALGAPHALRIDDRYVVGAGLGE